MHYISKMTVLGADKGRTSIYKNVTCLSNYSTDRIGYGKFVLLNNFTFIKAGIKL